MVMTLKEKLEQYIDPQIDVIHLEQVADDYAIEFAEWCMINYNKIYRENFRRVLEMFKKEKGL